MTRFHRTALLCFIVVFTLLTTTDASGSDVTFEHSHVAGVRRASDQQRLHSSEETDKRNLNSSKSSLHTKHFHEKVAAQAPQLLDTRERASETGVVPASRVRRSAAGECAVDCSRAKPLPVCGTDGKMYPHRCDMKRVRRCEGRKVRVCVCVCVCCVCVSVCVDLVCCGCLALSANHTLHGFVIDSFRCARRRPVFVRRRSRPEVMAEPEAPRARRSGTRQTAPRSASTCRSATTREDSSLCSATRTQVSNSSG